MSRPPSDKGPSDRPTISDGALSLGELDTDRPDRTDPLARTAPRGPADASAAPEHRRIFLDGQRVGEHYEITKLLGAGGMGQVYEAQDHSLNRKVAIKVAWPESRGSLAKEARALAAFEHPSLLRVLCLGKQAQVDFLVMERIVGVSLEERIEHRRDTDTPFSVEEVCDLVADVADGLSVIHRAGIAHRDVKPENIMLTPQHRVVLMDFGLVIAETDAEDALVMAGSPAYMSPEALAHDVRKGAAPLADIYALGVVMFRLLTEHYPRAGESIAELFREHNKPVPKPSSLRGGIPRLLDDLVVQCLSREPTERPHSAESVSWRLKNLQTDSQAPVDPESFNVLVVDDDKDVARIVAHYVRKALVDAKVTFAHDGTSALASMRAQSPDLLLLDLHMPETNGLEVVMAMRGDGVADGASIIVVSASAQPQDIELLHQFGVHHVVTKDHGLENAIREAIAEMFGGSSIVQTVRPEGA